MMKTEFTKFFAVILTVCSLVIAGPAFAQVAKDATVTSDIDTGGPGPGFEYYGSGNDDAFAEYGLATFNFTAADFGGSVSEIVSADLSLTVNDRSFSDGDMVEVFFTPDTGADLDSGGGDFSALFYDTLFAPSGIDGAQYVTAPVSLGVFAIPEMAGRVGGEVDVLSLPFDGATEAALVGAINSGTDFQLMIAATQDSHDITYSGVGNTFDPGAPNLRIVVPEPSAMCLLLGMVTLLLRRR